MVSQSQPRRPSRRQLLRTTALGAAAFAAAPVLSACGGGSGGSSGKATVRVWHWYDQQRDQWPRMIAEFEEANPNVKVEERQFGDPDSYLPALQAAVAAGDPPEIFAPHVLAIEYGRAGISADLRAGLGEDFLGGFFQSANDLFVDEGKQFGLGWMAQTFGIFYHPKHFERAGVDIPETWDDLLAVSAAIRETGVEPCVLSNNPGTNGLDFFLPLITQVTDDPQLLLDLDLQRDGASWDSPEVVEALELVRRLQDGGAFAANPNGITTAQGEQMLYTDRAAMLFMGSWVPQDFVQDAPPEFVEEYRVMKTPALTSGARHWCSNQAGAAFAVSETSPNKEAALDLLRFMYEPDRYSQVMNESNSMPATSAAAEQVTDPVLAEMTSWLLDGDGAPHILMGPGSSESASNAVSALIDGSSSAQDAAADIQSGVERAANR
ncbi:ABC transporter substrate-binding protein [Streptomyces sp. NBRC 109706]|uniref:ABC transporter substrate-binding protein n=1 Tax=Streptomyces sp. NBRC 109706 TaxID=1550035 RepID=UPI000781215F|nr:extracellular solute-binding protein [Streptomyces sp. NBRC 109706]